MCETEFRPEIDTAAAVPLLAASSAGVSVADAKWYAVTVFPRHEKCVAQHLEARGINYLLPLYSSLRRWRDRRKRVEMVLFPGYVFVNVEIENRLGVLMLPGVSRARAGCPAVATRRIRRCLRAARIRSRSAGHLHRFLPGALHQEAAAILRHVGRQHVWTGRLARRLSAH